MRRNKGLLYVLIALITSCTKEKSAEYNRDIFDGGGVVTLADCGGTLQSCTISPTGETLTIGSTLQFNAVGKFSNSNVLCSVSPTSWSSSNSSIASINSQGLATGNLAGEVNIGAVVNSVQCAAAQLTVQYASCPTITSAQAIDAVTPLLACGGSPLNWFNMVEIDITFSNPAGLVDCSIWDASFAAYGNGASCNIRYYFPNSYIGAPRPNPSPITIAYGASAVNYGACDNISNDPSRGCFVGYWPLLASAGQPPRTPGGTLCLSAGFNTVSGCQGSIRNLDCTTTSPQRHCYYNIFCSSVTSSGLTSCTVQQ